MTTASIQTEDGIFIAYFSKSGLAGLDFPTGETTSPMMANELSAPWNS